MAEGITSQSQTYEELKAGDVEEFYGAMPASASPVTVGQVAEFNTTSNDFVKYTSGSGKPAYAVCAEAKTFVAAARVRMIVAGKVRKDKLDATAQADAEIEGALLGSGIIPVSGITA